jgi:hypothetical protein
MNVSLTQRCVYHAHREAVARCPECARFFCRECVSEHEDRVLCASCLARVGRVEKHERSVVGSLLRSLMAVLGLLTAWWFFDLLGQGLMKLPASVHEGTVWESAASEE